MMERKQEAAVRMSQIRSQFFRGQLTRREFLQRANALLIWAGLGGASAVLSGCGPSPAASTPEPTTPPEPTAAPPTESAVPSGEVVWITAENTSQELLFADWPDTIDRDLVLLTDSPAMIQKLRVGTTSADVVEVNYAFMHFMREYDLIQPIDDSKLANWDKVLPAFKKLDELYNDQGHLELVPCIWGTDAIAYNADEVDEADTGSYEVLFSDKYAGRIAVRNDAQETLAWVGIVLGHEDIWNQTEEELAESLEFLKEHKDKFRLLWTSISELEEAFINGEVVVCQSWYAIMEKIKRGGINAKWAEPEEGSIAFLDGYCISKDARDLDTAHYLIDFVLGDSYTELFFENTSLRRCTDWFTRNLPQEEIERLSFDDIDGLFERSYVWGTTLNLEQYQQTWTEFLSA